MKKKKKQLLVHKNVKKSSGKEIQQISHQHSADWQSSNVSTIISCRAELFAVLVKEKTEQNEMAQPDNEGK